jgi:hypothetical protein
MSDIEKDATYVGDIVRDDNWCKPKSEQCPEPPSYADLERERDEARRRGDEYGHKYARLLLERDQLRKVCDALAKSGECCHGPGFDKYCANCLAHRDYNELPHVKENQSK